MTSSTEQICFPENFHGGRGGNRFDDNDCRTQLAALRGLQHDFGEGLVWVEGARLVRGRFTAGTARAVVHAVYSAPVEIPGYLEIVKDPLDVGTIVKRLETKPLWYTSALTVLMDLGGVSKLSSLTGGTLRSRRWLWSVEGMSDRVSCHLHLRMHKSGMR